MAGANRSIGIIIALACLVLTGCAATRQHTDLTLRGDLPTRDMRGRTSVAARRAVQTSQARNVTAALPCASDDVESVAACRERVNRLTLEPITSLLGKPPRPADIARREAPAGIDTPAGRERVRAAYADAVRERYRSYAIYVSGQLAGADWVDITDADKVAHRYSEDRIPGRLDATLVAMGDRYAAVEWNQFLRQRPPQAATRATGKTEHAVARSGPGASPGNGAGAHARSEVEVGPQPEEPAPAAARPPPEP